MWNAISNVGDAALTLPIAVACAIWLGFSGPRLAVRWIALLAAGMALVGITKVLYAGCGIEITSLDFRVISGHTTLSTAVWGVAFALLFRCAGKNPHLGALVGLLVGVLTAVARVFDDAHTVTEVIVGWMLGATIAMLFLRSFARSETRLLRPHLAAFGLLLVASVAYGRHAPFQAMIEDYSPGVCARIMASAADSL